MNERKEPCHDELAKDPTESTGGPPTTYQANGVPAESTAEFPSAQAHGADAVPTAVTMPFEPGQPGAQFAAGSAAANAVNGSADAPVPAGRSAGRYQVRGEVARGGMGVVFRGYDNDLGRELAIKVLLPHHRDRPDLIERFIEEAQIAGRLQHPGVVPV